MRIILLTFLVPFKSFHEQNNSKAIEMIQIVPKIIIKVVKSISVFFPVTIFTGEK